MSLVRDAVLGYMLSFAAVASAQTCQLVPATVTKIENGRAWVYAPDQKTAVIIDGTEVDQAGHVWHAGPIEILRDGHEASCKVDIDLLEMPFMFARGRHFYFLSGDGVSVALKVIDTELCKVAWTSKPYGRERAPVMLPGEAKLRFSKTAVPLGDDCVPSALPATVTVPKKR